MAQWESQTRKMNRHYQSAGGRGFIYNPTHQFYMTQNISTYFYSSFNQDWEYAPDGVTKRKLVDFNIYVRAYEGTTRLWDDRLNYIKFYCDTDRALFIRRGQKTFQELHAVVTVPTTIVGIDVTALPANQKREVLSSIQQTPTSQTPLLDYITSITFEISDAYPKYGDSTTAQSVKGWWKFNKVNQVSSPYTYVNDICNMTFEQTADAQLYNF